MSGRETIAGEDSQVEPALVADTGRKDTTDSDTNDVGRRVDELPRGLAEVLGLVNDLADLVEGHGRDHAAVRNGRAVREVSNLLLSFDALDRRAELESLGGKGLGDRLPDSSGTVAGGEAESGVGSPAIVQASATVRQADRGYENAHQLPAVFLFKTFETTSLREGAATRSPSHSHCIWATERARQSRPY